MVLLLLLQASTLGAFWTKFFCRTAAVDERRIVRFVQATDDWSFDPNGWKEIVFLGRSVLDLKSAVKRELAQGNVVGIELRVQAGRLGHLTPLHINLPRDHKPMDDVALCTFAPCKKPCSFYQLSVVQHMFSSPLRMNEKCPKVSS
jgi:hypothetical protein